MAASQPGLNFKQWRKLATVVTHEQIILRGPTKSFGRSNGTAKSVIAKL